MYKAHVKPLCKLTVNIWLVGKYIILESLRFILEGDLIYIVCQTIEAALLLIIAMQEIIIEENHWKCYLIKHLFKESMLPWY